MSWSLTVPVSPKAEFDAAVDAAEPGGQPADLISEAVGEAKKAIKALAAGITRPNVGANAGGHVLSEGEGSNWHEGTSLNVAGYEDAG